MNDSTLSKDALFMKKVLPDSYTCEDRDNGVHCYSDIGITDDKGYDEHWEYIYLAVQQEFGKRFMEVYFHTSTYHKRFTVFLKPRLQKEEVNE